MKRVFIFFMLPQIRGETGVVGVCKRVHGIVNQLSGGVVVQQGPVLLAFQPAGNPKHKMLGVFVVVAPKPLGPEGALQVGGGVAVGFDAAQQKGGAAGGACLGEIGIGQIGTQPAVTFSAHVHTPSLSLYPATHYSRSFPECVNGRKNLRFRQNILEQLPSFAVFRQKQRAIIPANRKKKGDFSI